MINKPWYSPATLAWLQNLLEERFGHHFDLLPQSDGSSLAIGLPGDANRITLTLDGATFTRADSDLPCAQWDASAEGWHTALRGYLPVPGAASLPTPLVTATECGWHVGYDILGLSYWMLTRQEEVGRTDLDSHGRFPATASHAYKNGYLERPVVDEWLAILGQVMQRAWPSLVLKKHAFTMKVSHDVDRPMRYGFKPFGSLLRAMVGDVVKHRDFKNALAAPWLRIATKHQLHPADPFNTFDWLMDISESKNIKSAFYFICGRTAPDKDADYEPEHPAIRALMCRIHQRGHEIGLHPSFNTYQNPKQLKHEFDRLKKICSEEKITQAEFGGRMHYLRWEHPTTLQAWNDAGLAYDSTLSYADRPGFRCGTCFEYPGFNPCSQEQLKLRIRPLIAMECSVMGAGYMGLGDGDLAASKFLELRDVCKQLNGCFTLLWHNSELDRLSKRNIYAGLFCL